MVADKSKKQKIAEKIVEEEDQSNNPENIDGELVLSIERLQEIQDELEKINEEASDKVLELEQKYNEVRKPIYDRRTDIVKYIPDFWLTAFMSHPALGELLTEEDQKIFKHLSSIEVEDSKDVKSGYSITFNFNPNPYFEDTKLMKTFTFLDEGTIKVTGTSIKWKDGMGLPNGVCNEKKGKKRSHTEESFFSWFTGSQQKDDELDDIHDEIAEIIKDDLWPNPLNYFHTDADEEDSDEEDADDEERGSDDTEDDDNEPDDDEEDENDDED